jgi:hypothetical protein
MIKPVQVLVLSLATLAVSTLHSIKAPSGSASRILPPVAALLAVQTSLAVASQRERLGSSCAMEGARDRSRSVRCAAD